VCEDDRSRPPAPPVRGDGAFTPADIHLLAADGNALMAHVAHPRASRGIGVVIIPAMRGLGAFHAELAGRLAEMGLDAVAIDYYGRSAGDGPRDESFDFATHYELVREPQARLGTDADVRAAVDYLRSPEGGAVRAVYTLGFCYGGSVSWRQSATCPGLAGCIGFYGAPGYVLESIPAMQAPLLCLVAGDDRFVSAEESARFEQLLAEAGVPFEAKVYPGAPHSFFDRTFAEHRDACDDAWRRLLAFVERHAPAPATPLGVGA
jgi:carboxymethylenebutenolidase